MSTISPARAATLLWHDLRFVVIDTETLTESAGLTPDLRREIDDAIEHVRHKGKPVALAPQRRYLRRLQHEAAAAAGLLSQSTGMGPDRAVTLRPALGPLPAPAVLDAPTANAGGAVRLISIALVPVAHRTVDIAGAWESLVNPGVPVDPASAAIHGLTDAHLRGAPTLAGAAPEILARLTPAPGERLVFVAHNAPFDLHVLRAEFARLDLHLPELPVLDTAGPLAKLVGVSPRDGSLDGLAEALGIAIVSRHSAMGDAVATAEAACRLLERAAALGMADVGEVLDAAGARTTETLAGSRPQARPPRGRLGVPIPPEHHAAHFALSAEPASDELDDWVAVAGACAKLRCADLGDTFASMVASAAAPPATVIDALTEVVRRRAAASDGPGVATALGAICAAIERACPFPAAPGFSGRYPLNRRFGIRLAHTIEALVGPCRRCDVDACPACRDARPCPRDLFLRIVARVVLDAAWTDGRMTRTSTLLAWSRNWSYHRSDPASTLPSGRAGPPAGPVLGDAALALALLSYQTYGEEADRAVRAGELIPRMIAEGCRDPGLWEALARQHATGGRTADLGLAVATCSHALGWMPRGTTDPAWTALELTRQQLKGRLVRANGRRVIVDGEAVNLPSHRARNPRTRPMRFVRG